ncbi:unnamed protein product [Phytomonas sp. Hart1]|nr:unnamed protein product [Phytomonas sp. Hart1]|eukprot:CCW67907.1 unnamed protein product [Phytomonas sp. isolate Hart1]
MEYIDQYADKYFDGHDLQEWLTHHADICIYIAALYLAFVFKGPDLVAKVVPQTKSSIAVIKKIWAVWNLTLSVFSLYGSLHITPLLIQNFRQRGMRDTLCTLEEDEFFSTRYGFAMALFAISKFPEFMDTFFLILTGKRNLPFLSWFHHVTIFIYCWYAYQQGSSILVIFASMNYVVHTIMYFYFALAEAGYKNLVKPFAMYITLLQILQMIGGLYMTSAFIIYKSENNGVGCEGATMALARGQMVIYAFCFYLFSKMFVENYVFTPKKATLGGSSKKK